MTEKRLRHVYGPVPSRRLGRSLGVDLVPFKTCSYDCIYCQLGRTTEKTIDRKVLIPVEDVLADLDEKLAGGVTPDVISLAGSGEPTLYAGLGELIRGIKARTGIPVAVLTNGSLLWREDVRKDLSAADLVIPSLDAGDGRLFEYVNRPHPGLTFEQMTEGLVEFTSGFSGEVRLEVFLLDGVTSGDTEVKKIASWVERIRPARVELNTVTRPPGEDYAFPVGLDRMRNLAGFFPGRVDVIGGWTGKESAAGEAAGSGDEDVLDLLRRRPCTKEDVAAGLGLHLTEAIKKLDRLDKAGKTKRSRVGSLVYYAAAEGDDLPR
ncbi:MAG: radical SAM protein [Candidatus Aminicenantes bacterium]|nr:radical SAM protein [Candidatus Aminicenantes bacterium]